MSDPCCTSGYLDRPGVPLVDPILLDDREADTARPVRNDSVGTAR